MKTEMIRNSVRCSLFAAFSLIWCTAGCSDPATGTFDVAASKKLAEEKAIGPGTAGSRPKKGPSAAASSSPVASTTPSPAPVSTPATPKARPGRAR